MLLYFILGSLFSQVVLPLLDGIAELFLVILESGKGFFSVKCAKYNKQISQLTGEEPKEEKKRPIGFFTSAIGEQLDEPDEDEEEEFDE